MKLWTVMGVTVAAAVFCALLRKRQPEQGLLLGLLAGITAMAAILPRLVPLLQAVGEMAELSPTLGEYGPILVKGLGICLLTETAADACRDAGEQGLAAKTELAGKTVLLLLAVPLFEQVTRLAAALITGQEAGGA